MNWLIRYLLGLPAREQDLKEIKTNFPELIDNPEELNKLDYPILIHPRFFSEKSFKDWIGISDNNEVHNRDFTSECPYSNCPQKARENLNDSQESELLELMTIGGGKKSKTPKDSFFDMVRKIYTGTNNIKKVILTDPYLLADVSMDGNEGGFNNIIEYLKIIIDSCENEFELLISPTLKEQGNKDNFERLLKTKFKNIKFSFYSSDYNFHDRLLITVDNKQNYKGMFGPSFNGLNSKSIVLYGQLEATNTIDKLKNWFN